MRQLVQRSRRDATRVIYDILMQSANGVSRTHLIFRTNINHKLAKKYCVFLLKKHLLKLEADSDGTRYLLTERGERLLVLLREVEKELSEFYNGSFFDTAVLAAVGFSASFLLQNRPRGYCCARGRTRTIHFRQ